MKWPKDRKRAFLCAAEAFGTPYSKRTEKQKSLTMAGICDAIEELTYNNSIYFWAARFNGKGYWWSCGGTTDDEQRSLFCSLMAALSDKEFEELAKDV